MKVTGFVIAAIASVIALVCLVRNETAIEVGRGLGHAAGGLGVFIVLQHDR